jgi:hypothetical protein
MTIWRSFITEKAMSVGDTLLLKKQWQFCDLLLLKK